MAKFRGKRPLVSQKSWQSGVAVVPLNALSAMELDRTEQKKAHLPS
jgi:hypothetical protein